MKKIVHIALLITVVLFVLTGCIRVVVPAESNDDSTRAVDTPPVRDEHSVTNLRTPSEIFEDNADAVFTIYTSIDNDNFFSTGSGFFVCDSGIAVTNHHVISGWPYAIIRTHNGREYDIIGYYSYYLEADIAIIQVRGRRFPYLTIGDSHALRIGDSVYAIGSPLGYHNTFSVGVVSRFDDVAEFDIYRVYGMIQFTAPISGGSSGGALINSHGHVIGITTAGYGADVAQAINFAVPIASLDLSSTEDGRHRELPLGDISDEAATYVVGTWLWHSGHYVFNENGSGSRVWSGVPANFVWRVSGDMIVLSFADGSTPERWELSVVNENEITIGGAQFTRTEIAYEGEAGLEGIWLWDGGHYIFEADGSGGRVWDGTAATFEWEIVRDILILTIPNEPTERWGVNILNEMEVTIGGAAFTRTLGLPAVAEQLVGTWSWAGGEYVFYESGSGSRVWDMGPETFVWHVEHGILRLVFPQIDDEHWAVIYLDEDTITVGGADFRRVR